MSDSVVKVGITADATQLKAQFSSAADATLSGSQKMAQAMAQAKQAAAALGATYKTMGEQAAAGNMVAVNAIVEHMAAAEGARAAVDALAQSQRSLAEVETGGVGKLRTMNAEVRSLQGGIFGDTRAASEFLNILPGVGKAMEMAFPIFGVAALIGVLVDAGVKAYDLYEKFIDLDGAARDFSKTVNKMGDRDFLNVHSIETAEKRIQQTTHAAGLQLGMATAITREWDKSSGAVDAFTVAMEKMNRETGGSKGGKKDSFATAMSGISPEASKIGTTDPYTALSSITMMTQADAAAKAGYAARLQSLALIQKEAPLQHEITMATIEARHALDGELLGHQAINAALQKKLEMSAAEQQYTAQRDKDPDAGKQMESLRDQVSRGEAAAANKKLSAQELLRSMEQENATERALHQITIGEEATYWRDRLGAFEKGSTEYEDVVNKVNAAMIAEGKNAARIIKEGKDKIKEAQRKSAEGVRDDEQYKRDQLEQEHLERVKKMANEMASLHQKAADAGSSAALKLAVVGQAQATGKLSAFSAEQQRAAIHAEMYTEKLAALNAQLDLLKSQVVRDPLTNLPASGFNDNAANEKSQQAIQSQIANLSNQKSSTGTADQTKAAQTLAQPYLTAFGQINQGWLGMQDKLIFGTRRIGLQFQNMGAQMVISMAADLERMLAQYAEHEAIKLALHLVTSQTMNAQKAEAEAQAAAVKSALAVGQVTSSAAVGGAAAAAGAAAGGPIAAAVAGGATFGMIEGTYAPLAAFEKGGVISGAPGSPVPIMGHAGERVLSSGQTKMFESLVNARAGAQPSGGVTVHNHTNFQGITDSNFRDMAMKHSDIIGASVRHAYRNSGHRTVH